MFIGGRKRGGDKDDQEIDLGDLSGSGVAFAKSASCWRETLAGTHSGKAGYSPVGLWLFEER